MVSRKKQILKRAGALICAVACLCCSLIIPASAHSTVTDMDLMVNFLHFTHMDYYFDSTAIEDGDQAWISFPYPGAYMSSMSGENTRGEYRDELVTSSEYQYLNYYFGYEKSYETVLGAAQRWKTYMVTPELGKSMNIFRLRSAQPFVLDSTLWEMASYDYAVYIGQYFDYEYTVTCTISYPVLNYSTNEYDWVSEDVSYTSSVYHSTYGTYYPILPQFSDMFGDCGWDGRDAICYDLKIHITRWFDHEYADDVNQNRMDQIYFRMGYLPQYYLPDLESFMESYQFVRTVIVNTGGSDDYSGFGSALTSIVGSFLDVEIFPSFRLSNLLQFVFGVFVVFLIIKIFGG